MTSGASDPLAETAALADQTDATLPPRVAADTEPGSWESVGAARGEPPEVSPAHYQMLGEQGRGGLGRVLRARDLRTGRLVAIKEILRGSDAAVRRFRREALVTANLQHPAIVPVYEVGRWPDGQPFYAMKLVDGVTLSSAIHDATAVGDRLALVPHVIQVADALAYAHAQGWIHRDLKPGNVLVGAFGETVVIDWGLAKRIASVDSETTLEPARDPATPPGDDAATLDGQVLGTPVYMPPEQARGEAVDARADVYAIGALLYHVLAGVPPYHGAGTAANVLAKVTAGPPRPLAELAPTLPAELGTIVARAMAHRADDRYPSARELADDLARFRAGSLVAAHSYTRWQLVRRWLRRHRTAVAVAALAVAALLAVGTISFRENLIARRRAEAEGRRATAAQAVAEERRRDAEARVVALHTEQGLRELTAGSPARALPYLADAFRKAPDDPIAAFLIGRALEASERLELAVRTGSVASLSFGGARVMPLSPVAAPVIDLEQRRALAPIPGMLGVLAPDGAWLVARDDADVVLAIDAATGTVRARRANPVRPSVTRWVGIDRSGRVITLDDHGVIQVSASDLVPIATAQVPFAPDHAVIVDARHVIVTATDGGLWRWDATTGTATRPTSPHRERVTALCASADGGIWISMDPGVTAVWRGDALVGQVATAGLPGNCAIDRAGRVGVTSTDGSGVTRWDLTPRRPAPAPTRVRPGRTDVPNYRDTVALSGDGETLAIGDSLGVVELIEVRTGLSLGRTLGHDAPVVALGFSPDDRHLVTATLGGDVRSWRNAPASEVAAIAIGERSFGSFLDDDRAVIVGTDGARLVAVSDGRTLRELVGHTADVTTTAVAAQGDRFATSSRDGTTRLWRGDGSLVAVLAGSGERMLRASFSRAGDRVLTVAPDGALALWRGADGTLERRLASAEALFAARLSPDGQRVVTLHDGSSAATLWHAATGAPITELDAIGTQGVAAHFTPDGALVAVPAAGFVLGVFDAERGALRHELHHEGQVIAAAWSPDGALLASSDMAGTIHLSDRRGTIVRTFRVDSAVTAIGFHPAGRVLAVATEDGVVRIHELAGGRELTRLWRRLRAHELAFSPRGDRVVLVGGDGQPVLLWNVAPYRGSPDQLDARVRCAVPYRLDPSAGLVAAATDPAACR